MEETKELLGGIKNDLDEINKKLGKQDTALRWYRRLLGLSCVIIVIIGALSFIAWRENGRRIDDVQSSRIEGCLRNNATLVAADQRWQDFIGAIQRVAGPDAMDELEALIEDFNSAPSASAFKPVDCEALINE